MQLQRVAGSDTGVAELVKLPAAIPVDLEFPCVEANEASRLILWLRGVPLDVPIAFHWLAFQRLAEENGVLLAVSDQLRSFGADVPESFRQAAAEARADAEAKALALERLLHHFRAHRIEALPLKGPAMALALYGDSAARQVNDLDVLVRRRDYPRAEALLMELGFAALGPSSDHDRRFLRGAQLVELHFELASPKYFPFDVAGVWRRSNEADFRGAPARAMGGGDLVLYLCAHGLKHGFSRLIWILDVARALRGWPDGEYRALVRQANRQGLLAWLLLGCEVVRIVFPEEIPASLDEAMAEYPDRLIRASRAAQALFSAAGQTDAGDYRTLYLRAEASWLRRWRYRLRYLTRTGTDGAWAQRHRIPAGWMVVLRPFRLIEKYGMARVWRILFPSGI